MVSGCTFRSFTYFDFIFVYGMRNSSCLIILPYSYLFFPTTFIEETVFTIVYFCANLNHNFIPLYFLLGYPWIKMVTKFHTQYNLDVKRKYRTCNLVFLSNPHPEFVSKPNVQSLTILWYALLENAHSFCNVFPPPHDLLLNAFWELQSC